MAKASMALDLTTTPENILAQFMVPHIIFRFTATPLFYPTCTPSTKFPAFLRLNVLTPQTITQPYRASGRPYLLPHNMQQDISAPKNAWLEQNHKQPGIGNEYRNLQDNLFLGLFYWYPLTTTLQSLRKGAYDINRNKSQPSYRIPFNDNIVPRLTATRY